MLNIEAEIPTNAKHRKGTSVNVSIKNYKFEKLNKKDRFYEYFLDNPEG